MIEHGVFDAAFKFFNAGLFGNSLPDTLITLQRKNKMRGYYSSDRFGARDGTAVIDEIALNPSSFAMRTDEEVLSTLVHEMIHSWQKHYGTKPTRGYHDREWAAKMEELGLIPSHTGEPGGRRTGRQMTHFIAPDGLFARVVGELMAQGFLIAYVENGPHRDDTVVDKSEKPRLKVAFACDQCGAKAWGKPTLKIRCDVCNMRMEA